MYNFTQYKIVFSFFIKIFFKVQCVFLLLKQVLFTVYYTLNIVVEDIKWKHFLNNRNMSKSIHTFLLLCLMNRIRQNKYFGMHIIYYKAK